MFSAAPRQSCDLRRCADFPADIPGSSEASLASFSIVKRFRSAPFILLPIITFFNSIHSSHQNSRLPPIYWNASNPIFSSLTSDTHPPVIDVRLGDSIDITCPLFTHEDGTRLEYYTLYQVTKSEFDNCAISKLNERETKWIFDCKHPFAINAFTINFVRYSPQPKGLQFEPGRDYYFTSTSTGLAEGLQSMDGGVCRHRGMKLIFRVCCSDPDPLIVNLDNYDDGSTINASEEDNRLDNDVPRERVSSPLPQDKVFPSPKILRVITESRDKQNNNGAFTPKLLTFVTFLCAATSGVILLQC